MKLSYARTVLASALLTAGLSACVVAPAPGYAAVSYTAPPAVRVETVGVAPAPGYFWVGGAWFWEGGRYAWHPGYWQAPRHGYHWVVHGWHHEGGGWRMEPGHWVRG